MTFVYMAEDKEKWQAIMNGVVKAQVQPNAGTCRLVEELLACHRGLCCMERVSEFSANVLCFMWKLHC